MLVPISTGQHVLHKLRAEVLLVAGAEEVEDDPTAVPVVTQLLQTWDQLLRGGERTCEERKGRQEIKEKRHRHTYVREG